MLHHIETLRNVQFGPSPRAKCDYLAKYEQDTAVIMVVGSIKNPPRCDALAIKDFTSGLTIIFQDGYMIGLDEFNCGGRFRSDLTLRHDHQCIDNLRILLHTWMEEHFEVFNTDEYMRRHPSRFKELLDAEEIELPHGLTYKVLGLQNGEATVADFAKAITVEQSPHFRESLVAHVKDYAVGRMEKPAEPSERIMAARLLECIGETKAAEHAKSILFSQFGREIRQLYDKTATMKKPQPEVYLKRRVANSFIRDF